MKTSEHKEDGGKVQIEPNRSKYAGKPLNSEKEEAAKKIEGAVMAILKRRGIVK